MPAAQSLYLPPGLGGFDAGFDDAAADRLSAALYALADEVSATRRRLLDAGPAVTEDWLGPSRRWFDDRLDTFLAVAARLLATIDEDLGQLARDRQRAEGRRQELARLAALAATAPTDEPEHAVGAGPNLAWLATETG